MHSSPMILSFEGERGFTMKNIDHNLMHVNEISAKHDEIRYFVNPKYSNSIGNQHDMSC